MGNENLEFLPDDPQPGPSWQRAGWPLVGGAAEDDLTQALDPTAMKAAIKNATKQAGAPLDEAAIEAAANDSIRAMMLSIRSACRIATSRPT
jgi:2-oxoglutarate dehydrogenase E1 component